MKKLILVVALIIITPFLVARTSPAQAAPVVIPFVNLSPETFGVFNIANNNAMLTFYNLNKVKYVSYTLTYTSNGVPKGVIGSFEPNNLVVMRNDFLGTCSGNVCVKDQKVKNIKIEVKYTFINNSTKMKTYNIF